MIQIKNPCDANWQEMTPAESGKFCGDCEKVVVDFSKMSDTEIKNYFVAYKDQKTCGRFLDSQLERPLVVPSVSPFNAFLNRLNQIPVARTVLLFLTSTSMWISGCVNNKTTGELNMTDSTEKCNTPPTIDDTITTIIKQPSNGLLIKQDPNEMVMGEIAPVKITPPDFLMGDVVVSTPPDENDTVAFMIPAVHPDTSDVTLHLIKGQVMLRDTITQEIKRKKKIIIQME